MFNKSNFCHIASNNRNDQKGSVFIYKTSDTLAQVTQSGYFNEKLIDINLHDLIIHVQYNPVGRTLKKSVLIVTERTLDNVATQPITDETILNDLGDLGEQVAGIEEKIPSDASSTNQLATESDITNKITNCITEIPQDIKLELNNGTLTLKAGSKVYVPNGAGVFNVVTIASDLTRTTNTGGIVFVNSTGTSIYTETLGSVYSGDSAPSSRGVWYDTASNLVKFSTDGQTWSGQYSFPIGIVSTGGGQITSIDQVFNGFGYIGSTVFALPGVKGLVPNGRNADGTLKNADWTTSSITLRTYSSAYNGEYDVFFYGSSFGALKNTYIYDKESNYNMYSNNRYNSTYIGKASITSGTISKFATKNAFHSVDYSDTEYIAHQAMPSGSYADLTLGASGNTYTMPADGFLWLRKQATAVGQFMLLQNTTSGLYKTQKSATSVGFLADYIPVSKNDIIRVEYTLDGDSVFKFFYANGAK